MNFYDFLKRENDFKPRMIAISCLSGIISTVIASIIVMCSDTAEAGVIQLDFLIMFLVCLISFYFCKHYSLTRVTEHVEKVINQSRKRISKKIQETNLLNFENIGKEIFYTTLTIDSQIISQSSIQIINAAGSLVMVVSGLVGLFFISPIAFFMSIFIFVIIHFTYRKIRIGLIEEIKQTTIKENEFFSALNDHLLGFKELKLNKQKSDDFIENNLYRLSNEVFDLKVKSAKKISTGIILSQIFMYVILGAVVFILPNVSPGDTNIISPASALLLFITGPIVDVFAVFSVLDKTHNCINNIVRLENTLDEIGSERSKLEKDSARNKTFNTFKSLKCENATFSYRDEHKGESFTLGPINFELKQNEIVFIVGGNGSGKSTFLKMITSLYPLSEGKLFIDDKSLSLNKVSAYRSLFSPIFVDFHIFDRIYGLKDIDYNKVDALLEEMALDDVTDIVDRRVTKRELSTGQRKRLGLILSILEDKQIFLFDEVAADQDPHFRKYFYESILPKLKADGKTILAVTHDDKYFSCADRVLKMDYGKFVPYEA